MIVVDNEERAMRLKKKPFHVAAMLGVMALSALARDTVVLVAAHPDDLAGSAGTMLLLSEKFDVKVVDFTRGEYGLGEGPYRDGSCAKTRVEEEKKACAMLGTVPVFLDAVDYKGELAYADEKTTKKLSGLFKEWNPRAVILHWPLDTHPDHVQSYAVAIHALFLAHLSPEIYFQEQTTQSRNFQPQYHVDVTRVKDKKAALIRCYACQGGEAMAGRKERDSVFRAQRIGQWRMTSAENVEAFASWAGSVKNGKSIFYELNTPVY